MLDIKGQRLENLKLLVFSIFVIIVLQVNGSFNTPLTKADFIRFHVIANSNTIEDQTLKLELKDEMVKELNENLLNMKTIEESREYIAENIEEIEDLAKKIIEEKGYKYDVSAELGDRFIPEKTYGSVTFPSGIYESLNINIGKAEGENWWCVLYPPLCLIDSSEQGKENLKTNNLEMGENIIIDKKYNEIVKCNETGTPLKLKFKTAEILGKGR